MAKVTQTKTHKTVDIADGEAIKDACKELGVPFSCETGYCGTCNIHVEKGEENLEPMNENEKVVGMSDGHRLACQCKLKQGEIEIDF